MKSELRRVRRLIRSWIGMDVFPSVERQKSSRRLGSKHGGWEILPNLLNSDSVVYSVGVGTDISFDLELIQRHNLVVQAFDPTPKSIEWIHTQVVPQQFVLHEFGVAAFDGDAEFFPPANPDHVSHTLLSRSDASGEAIVVPMKTLSTIVSELGHEQIDLLKMDIEGGEYEVIESLLESNIRPTQLLIEFHHRFPGVGVARTKGAIRSLQEAGYRLFSVSDSGEEFSFALSAR